jgi:hypothetical protein
MSEIINFENGKYVWEDILTKGRCLVPYKDDGPIKKGFLKAGQRITIGGNYHLVIESLMVPGTFNIIRLATGQMYFNGHKTLEVIRSLLNKDPLIDPNYFTFNWTDTSIIGN